MSNNGTGKMEPCAGEERSTWTPLDLRSGADWLVSEPVEVQEAFLNDLGKGALCALPFLFEFWAMPHQLPPDGNWRSWVILGGRGAGKTRAGAEWVRSQVEASGPRDTGKARRVALIGETYDQVRDVMVFGDSGILECAPPDRKPEWKASERKLIWPNGATAQAFSASDPEALRGPQFDAAWVDELAKWKKADQTWDMLQFALRLGDDPRVCVTTTPRNNATLRRLLESPSTVVTHAKTEANAANLAASFLAEVRTRYAGSRLARQELDGVMLSDVEGALWTSDLLEGLRAGDTPDLDRIVVAVDPSVTNTATSDACGIVVAGAVTQGPPETWRGFVLADCSVANESPLGWAKAAVRAFRQFGADRLVAEVNQGGALVEQVLRQVDPLISYGSLRAARGKALRAEPVAALYEQGRIRHVGVFSELEDEMVQMTTSGYRGQGSPDRTDALVWALHELLILPAASYRAPRMRGL